MVEAYIALAVEAADRYRDLDAAHDWLERALELDPENHVARRLLERVKQAEQDEGLRRAGVFLGSLHEVIIRQSLEKEPYLEGPPKEQSKGVEIGGPKPPLKGLPLSEEKP
jgi:hypothetical protein